MLRSPRGSTHNAPLAEAWAKAAQRPRSGRPAAPRSAACSRRVRANRAEQAVLLVVGSGGEEQRVGGAVVRGAVTDLERPQAVDGQRGAGRRAQLAGGNEEPREKFAVGADAAVAEVAHEQVARETAKGRRRP